MSDMEVLSALAAQMAEEGIRRLLILSGDDAWSESRARALCQHAGGDVLWVDAQTPARTLLGREFRHAVFDARHGFDVTTFAVLAGTLQAGSWLLLLAPPLAQWPQRPDADSLRWSDSEQPIATPNFIHHLLRVVRDDPQTLVWSQDTPLRLPAWASRPRWRPADGEPLAEQATILRQLLSMPPGVAAVTAGRGRGKSALAGMLIAASAGQAIVTAPGKNATDVLARFADAKFRFMAPDALLASSAHADWLVVDEAAAIPGPLLAQLVARFPRTLLTTTVQGYEGTGRGFLLKFCARFPDMAQFTLSQPVRWAQGCPLEAVVSALLLFDDTLPPPPREADVVLQTVGQRAWQQDPALPTAMYRLLCAAHYRTSPLDLRRMMDAPGQHFISAGHRDALVGALWLVDEGGLSAELSQAVWAGFRRPRGNLVAQSLAAHGGSPLAATLTGRRISRIAVHPSCQRQGTGRQLVGQARAAAAGCDYLSVSFGYTDELWRFWQRCGFVLVRLGCQREASSGCYTAMALCPLTAAGEQLTAAGQAHFLREEPWLAAWRQGNDAPPTLPTETILTDNDWLTLAAFAFAHRPLLSALGSLNQLVRRAQAPLLAARLQGVEESVLCAQAGLSGRKALLAALREEAAAAMAQCDASRSEALRQRVTELQFF